MYLSELLKLPEPLRTKNIEKLDTSETYDVFNTGAEFQFKFQGKIKTIKTGKTTVPVLFAVHLLDKFQSNEFDKEAHIVVDANTIGKANQDDAHKATAVELKAMLKNAGITFKKGWKNVDMEGALALFESKKIRLDDAGVVYPENATDAQLNELIEELDKD